MHLGSFAENTVNVGKFNLGFFSEQEEYYDLITGELTSYRLIDSLLGSSVTHHSS
jgi:hypothetical protein